MGDAQGSDAVRTVKVRLREADLCREMETMREWLDSNGVELRKFDCEHHGPVRILSIEFRVDAEADAFARRFDGEIGSSPPSSRGQFGAIRKVGPQP